jgi:hypothetical protein
MTQLERQQRGLLDLIKNRSGPTEDAYFQRVANSQGQQTRTAQNVKELTHA